MVSLPLCHIDGKRQEKERYIPNPAIHIHTRSHFYSFRFAFVTNVESRPSDNDMVGNEIPRRTSVIRRAAYQRSFFGGL